MPIMTVSYEHKITEEIEQQIITTVKCAPKRSIYIKFLEESGIIDAFGNEIVREVANNLNWSFNKLLYFSIWMNYEYLYII